MNVVNEIFTRRFELTDPFRRGLLHTMTKDGELHITCDCHTHELHVERDIDPPPENWYVSFWLRGYGRETDWTWRLRCIWRIIKTGRPYGDEVVLSRPQMQELLDYVSNELNKK